MTKWFISGAAGFIGSNLCELLLSEGKHVVGYDDLSTGTIDNIDRLEQNFAKTFKFIEGDIRDPSALAEGVRDCDFIVHLAAQVSVPRSIDEPEFNDSVNIGGFECLLDACREIDAKRLVYASSCAVYGDTEDLPIYEEAMPRPLSPYAVSKLKNEYSATLFATKAPDRRVTGLRFFNVYGPWQNFEGGYASVIPKWIKLCLDGKQPEVYGDGSATRDFCFVEDVCRAIMAAAARDRGKPHDVFNVGSGKQTSLNELYNIIASELRRLGQVLAFDGPSYRDPREGDILHSFAEVTHSASGLGFKPETSLSDGVRQICKKQYDV